MRGVSSRDSPFSRRFPPLSLSLSPSLQKRIIIVPRRPVCWFTVILHFPYRRYLTRFLPPRVIAKRFQLTIEYFSNPLLPLSLDYSILIVPPSRLTSTFPLRNFSCLEIIKIFPSPFRKFARFLSLPFPFFFFEGKRGKEELWRVDAKYRNGIQASRILLPFPTGAFIPHYARFIVSRTKDDSPWRVLVPGAQTGTSISDFMNE